jgi:hypothetical protein
MDVLHFQIHWLNGNPIFILRSIINMFRFKWLFVRCFLTRVHPSILTDFRRGGKMVLSSCWYSSKRNKEKGKERWPSDVWRYIPVQVVESWKRGRGCGSLEGMCSTSFTYPVPLWVISYAGELSLLVVCVVSSVIETKCCCWRISW